MKRNGVATSLHYRGTDVEPLHQEEDKNIFWFLVILIHTVISENSKSSIQNYSVEFKIPEDTISARMLLYSHYGTY